MPGERPLAVISGGVAQCSGYGGHAWVFLQYLLGLRRLGFDVLLIDRLERQMIRGRPGADPAGSAELLRLLAILGRFGLAECFTVLGAGGRSIAGLPRDEVLARTRRSELLLNVMGFLDDAEILAAASRRVFLDVDPGFPQMWRALGLADVLAGHDRFVTVGARVGLSGSRVPTCGVEWIRTRPPVVLEHWPAAAPPAPARRGFMSIGAWRGPFGPLEYEQETYGLRVHEFRALSELPRKVDARFDAALDIDPADGRDAELLRRGGWRLLEAGALTADPFAYRRLIAGAGAELMVAKGMYVRSHGGWFSDRSACFLASGKPVLALDTGLSGLYPVGRGLVTFDSLEGAVAGAQSIMRDYEDHARAARALAEEWFDSDRVLTELVDEVTAP
ncbi:MAG TPA: hypothetical protein VFF79_18395 [Conexibacter sp.]|jgi:hypothetical protein|nr:hypothetical protein [Conexibacter sp.]